MNNPLMREISMRWKRCFIVLAASIFVCATLGVPFAAAAEPTAAVPQKGRGGGRGTGGGGGGGRSGGGGGGPLSPSGSPRTVETIKGELTRVDGGEQKKGGTSRPGPMIEVRTEKETLQVHAGSPDYRREHKLDLRVGDVVEITGTRGVGKASSSFSAYSIKKGDQVVRLRDESGKKLWKPRKRGGGTTELGEIRGKVVELDLAAVHSPGSGLGRATKFIAVRTDTEVLAIEAGPDNYRESQGVKLTTGDEVVISGWRLPSARTADKPIMLAASITKGKAVAKLRDERRRPLWNKK
jgi:hypothetical protein